MSRQCTKERYSEYTYGYTCGKLRKVRELRHLRDLRQLRRLRSYESYASYGCLLRKTKVSSLNKGANLAGSGVEVVVAPPMLLGDYTRGMLRSDFGAAFQNWWVGGGGAFTGEVSADMIKVVGFDWVILGHFERRSLPELMETDNTVATRTAYALEAGLRVCIGEQLDERQSGKTDEVNARQFFMRGNNSFVEVKLFADKPLRVTNERLASFMWAASVTLFL